MEYQKMFILDGTRVVVMTYEQKLKNLENELNKETRYSQVADGYDKECALIKIQSIKSDMAETQEIINKNRVGSKSQKGELA